MSHLHHTPVELQRSQSQLGGATTPSEESPALSGMPAGDDGGLFHSSSSCGLPGFLFPP